MTLVVLQDAEPYRCVLLGACRSSPTVDRARAMALAAPPSDVEFVTVRLARESMEHANERRDRRPVAGERVAAALHAANTVVIALDDRLPEAALAGQLDSALRLVALSLGRRRVDSPLMIIVEGDTPPGLVSTRLRTLLACQRHAIGTHVFLGAVRRVGAGDSEILLLGANDSATDSALSSHYERLGIGRQSRHISMLTAEIAAAASQAIEEAGIALAHELARWCDERDIDFEGLRTRLTMRGTALDLPSPRFDGLCRQRRSAAATLWQGTPGAPARRSMLLQARRVNDAAPLVLLERLERSFGDLRGRTVALLGLTDDVDNNSSISATARELCQRLAARGVSVVAHDRRLLDSPLDPCLPDGAELMGLEGALEDAEIVVACSDRFSYRDVWPSLLGLAPEARAVFDACNAIARADTASLGLPVLRLGGGWRSADATVGAFAEGCVAAVARGAVNELVQVVRALNARFLPDEPAVCLGGLLHLLRSNAGLSRLPDPGLVSCPEPYVGFLPTVVRFAGRTGRRRSLSDRLSDVPQRVSGMLQPRPATPG